MIIKKKSQVFVPTEYKLIAEKPEEQELIDYVAELEALLVACNSLIKEYKESANRRTDLAKKLLEALK